MEVENIKKSTSGTTMYTATGYINKSRDNHEDELIDEDDVPLPGFRFHPTDEELVGFYLQRKVDKRPIAIELIKQIDIYKYDPWDLPKGSNVGDKEWYFYCKRGRKYKNSIRPNRVTGSGFWKATGIDRPIYSSSSSSAGAAGDINNANRRCIGLKKSLVYYRGSAGKGTKTDWMMHEFRLPPDDKTSKTINDQATTQEAEVWTLCRILKRHMSYRKCVPDWREVCAAAKRSTTTTTTTNNNNPVDTSSKSCSVESNNCQSYISFTDPSIHQHNERKPFSSHANNVRNYQLPAVSSQLSSSVCEQPPSTTTPTSYSNIFSTLSMNNEMLLKHGDWDELGSLVGFAADPFVMYNSSN